MQPTIWLEVENPRLIHFCTPVLDSAWPRTDVLWLFAEIITKSRLRWKMSFLWFARFPSTFGFKYFYAGNVLFSFLLLCFPTLNHTINLLLYSLQRHLNFQPWSTKLNSMEVRDGQGTLKGLFEQEFPHAYLLVIRKMFHGFEQQMGHIGQESDRHSCSKILFS